MKKVLYIFTFLLILTGCGMMNNTPTKKVEELLNKYQTNDSSVINDLDNVLTSDYSLSEDERREYSEFMKKHYQDMKYKIKQETIDGDSATVEVEITVRNYASAVNDANDYRLSNSDKFDEENTFASYRLKEIKKVSDTETYTLTFHLTKVNDIWQVEPLSRDDESKINGLYGVNDVNIESDIDDETNQNDENKNSTSQNASDTDTIRDNENNSSIENNQDTEENNSANENNENE